MGDPDAERAWDHHLMWPDGIPEPSPSLLEMLHESERSAHLHDDHAQPDGDNNDAPAGQANGKRDRNSMDDLTHLDPPGKSACKLDSQAAKLKANREKQRRAQLNGRYMELASLIEPGKTPKTDRNLILDDAVRVIGQLRAENNQVRQLNKFLEEKVREHEHARGQALYQQSLQMQGGMLPSTSRCGPAGPATHPPSAAAASTSTQAPTIPPPASISPPPAQPPAVHPPPGPAPAPSPATVAPAAAPAVTAGAVAPGIVAPPSADGGAASQQVLAMQMMNMAMQLMQSQNAQAAASGVAAGDPVAGSVPDWLQAFEAPAAVPLNTSAPSVEQQQAAAAVAAGRIGFKPQAAGLQEYTAAVEQGGSFCFPPLGGMPAGWPPADMVNETLDEKLRPPAA